MLVVFPNSTIIFSKCLEKFVKKETFVHGYFEKNVYILLIDEFFLYVVVVGITINVLW